VTTHKAIDYTSKADVTYPHGGAFKHKHRIGSTYRLKPPSAGFLGFQDEQADIYRDSRARAYGRGNQGVYSARRYPRE
jgi:hypothetical protein